VGKSNRERRWSCARSLERESNDNDDTRCEVRETCSAVGDFLAEFRAGFKPAPAAGDRPGAGAGSTPAGGGSAGRGGALGLATGGGRCRHGALMFPVILVCAVGPVSPLLIMYL
jgi:hypothetical protein